MPPAADAARARISPRDRHLLRELARRVAEVAALPVQSERARLWLALNRLRPERPMVLTQIGSTLPASVLRCEDELCRQWEHALRWKLHRHTLVPDDYPCTDCLDLRWVTRIGDFGVTEGRIYGEVQGFGAYRIDPPIRTEEDLGRLRTRSVHVDHEATSRLSAVAQDVVGDLVRVRLQGETTCRDMLTRKLIHLRGFEQFLLDLYDAPALLHRMMAFLRDDVLHEWETYEREGVLSLNNEPDHIRGTGGVAHTDLLPAAGFDGHVRLQDMACFSESQESVGVGPDLFWEFVLHYQLPLMRRFGQVDYGCCEPLDAKYDLLFAHIPQLCSVSVHPWGDREQAAEKLSDRYVYAYKPHPGVLELPVPDWESAEGELRQTLEMARGCCVSLTMKAGLAPGTEERATRWTEMAQRVVAEMA